MNSLFESNVITERIAEISKIAGYLWQKGWAERNAGNLSVNISRELSGTSTPHGKTIMLQPERSALAGQSFLLTASGSRMREIVNTSEEGFCLVRVNENGSSFQQTCQDSSMCPTSELPAHLGIHEMLLKEKPEYKAIVHTHCTELIALTHIRNYCSTASINRLLWSMHPETMLFAPKGMGFIPFTVPGTEKISKMTVETLRHHDIVVWEKHGVMAIGATISEAFDLIDLMAKAAGIFFTVRNAGYYPEGLSDAQLGQIKKGTT